MVEIMSPEDRKALGQKTVAERSARADLQLEREIHRLIDLELNRRNIVGIHSRTDKKTSQQVGVPDYLMALWDSERGCARPVAVEVKLPGGKLSDDQIVMRDRMVRDGWEYHVVYSLEEFKSVLSEFDV